MLLTATLSVCPSSQSIIHRVTHLLNPCLSILETGMLRVTVIALRKFRQIMSVALPLSMNAVTLSQKAMTAKLPREMKHTNLDFQLHNCSDIFITEHKVEVFWKFHFYKIASPHVIDSCFFSVGQIAAFQRVKDNKINAKIYLSILSPFSLVKFSH